MGLESATYVDDLNSANPTATDQKSQGDDHLRLLKAVLKATFPNSTKAFRFPDTVAKTAAYTTVLTDHNKLILCDATTAAFTITLLAAATATAGHTLEIKKTDTSGNAVTIDGNAAETIDGATTLLLRSRYSSVVLVSDGSNWHTVSQNTSGGWELLDRQTAAASATLDFIKGITSAYDAYMLMLSDILPATDNVNIRLRASTDGGSTFLAGAADYEYNLAELQAGVAGWSSLSGSAGDTKIDLNSNGLSNASGEQCSGTIMLFSPATFPRVVWDIAFWDDTATAILTHAHGAGAFVNGGTAINGLRLLMSSGNIASGTAALYGLRKI